MRDKFKSGLDRALHSLEDEDPRLKQESGMELVNAGQTRAQVSTTMGPNLVITPVHTQLKNVRGRPLKESLDMAPEGVPDAAGAGKPELNLGGGGDDLGGDEITDADLPQDGQQKQDPAAGGEVPGLPSGNNYTIDQAKGQLDGIVKNWMDLAGNYPEGEQRHNFIEIGERLREISAVLNRDFMNANKQQTPQ